MADPWSAMGDEDDDGGMYLGPDAYVEGDDEADLDYEDELEADQTMALEQEVRDLEEESVVGGAFHTIMSGAATSAEVDVERLLASVPMDQLFRIFGARTRIFQEEEEEESEDDAPISGGGWFAKVTEPQEAGVELLNSGDFGRVRNRLDNGAKRNIYNRLRQTTLHSRSVYREDIAHDLIPNTHGTAVASYGSNIYCGQYSLDSTMYYACGQDFRLYVYDTTAPLRTHAPRSQRSRLRAHYYQEEGGHSTTMPTLKSTALIHGNWTITDTHLSPDNQRMIYSSMDPTVYMTKTLESESAEQTPIPFGDRSTRDLWSRGSPIWCCRWSADGNEVFAGGSGPIYVYDLTSNRQTVEIRRAHHDDVNSCCWADTASGNVLISGSDDGFVKVWDRRSLGTAQKPSGVLVGHTEGITYVSAKGDGRYVISNGKDQALRLWDLRQMRSSEDFDAIGHNRYADRSYDYRQGVYRKPRMLAHPKDCSVMTYRGHQVLRTLIRCHFSPSETTGGQYLYSGSYDGKIHIWSLDGRVVQVLDRGKTLPISFDPSAIEPVERESTTRHQVCVRDVSWHPQEPVLMSAAWENGRTGVPSQVARHEWKGLTKGSQLEDWVEKERLEREERQGPPIPGAYRDVEMIT